MSHSDAWLSIVPPVATLLAAVLSRKIIPSLVLGLWVGGLLSTGGVLGATIRLAEHIAGSISRTESSYIILFLFTFGGPAEMLKVSGGIKGFTRLADRCVKTERGAMLAVWAVTPATFLDCCFHVISTGAVARPLVEKVKGAGPGRAMARCRAWCRPSGTGRTRTADAGSSTSS